LSVLAVCDGTRAVALAPAQDFKRASDGGTGPNTGGMGAYSPVPAVGPDTVDAVMDTAVAPTLALLRAEGIDYRGVLYAGLMLTPDGPKMLEFNVRFGDPEAEVVLPRLDSDLAGLLGAAAEGDLRRAGSVRFDDGASVSVVVASPGYPGAPRTGDAISGLSDAAAEPGVQVFHAGTARQGDGQVVTAGGRVLAVTGRAPTLSAARQRAYAGVGHISWPGHQYRTDIALAAAVDEETHV
jgi:phosphoribosylamine--glycine ligase